MVWNSESATGAGEFILGQDGRTVILPFDRTGHAPEGTTYFMSGNCMQPALRPGDRLALEMTGGPPRPGWIVTFRWKGRFFTHRVVRTEGGAFWARGDLSTDIQGPVEADAVIGRVVGAWRTDRWRSLDGVLQGPLGAAYSRALRALLRLRRIARTACPAWVRDRANHFTSSRSARFIGGKILRGLEFDKSDDAVRIMGALLSDPILRDNVHLQHVEEALADGKIYLLEAHSWMARQVGSAVVLRFEDPGVGAADIVLSLLAPWSLGGLGVFESLLAEVRKYTAWAGASKVFAVSSAAETKKRVFVLGAGFHELGEMSSRRILAAVGLGPSAALRVYVDGSAARERKDT